MTDSITSPIEKKHKFSDAGLRRMRHWCFVILCANMTILLGGAILYAAGFEFLHLFPVYQTFAIYFVGPALFLAFIASVELGIRKWDKQQEVKRQNNEAEEKRKAEIQAAALEKFEKMTVEEKLNFLAINKGWLHDT